MCLPLPIKRFICCKSRYLRWVTCVTRFWLGHVHWEILFLCEFVCWKIAFRLGHVLFGNQLVVLVRQLDRVSSNAFILKIFILYRGNRRASFLRFIICKRPTPLLCHFWMIPFFLLQAMQPPPSGSERFCWILRRYFRPRLPGLETST